MHYNRPLRHELWRDVTVEHDWDAAVTFQNLLEGRPLGLIGARQIKWPGGGLGANQPFQYVEAEYMLQDEYDEFLADPSAFAVKKLLPRVAGNLAPFSAAVADAPPGSGVAHQLLRLAGVPRKPGYPIRNGPDAGEPSRAGQGSGGKPAAMADYVGKWRIWASRCRTWSPTSWPSIA